MKDEHPVCDSHYLLLHTLFHSITLVSLASSLAYPARSFTPTRIPPESLFRTHFF